MIVLDASFIVKLVLEEKGSDIAENLFSDWINSGEDIVTVDIALSESFNALWKHYSLLKDIDRDVLDEALKDLLSLWNKLTIVTTDKLAYKALDIAVTHGITIYDSLYLALAQHHKAALATFDKKQREYCIELGLKTYP